MHRPIGWSRLVVLAHASSRPLAPEWLTTTLCPSQRASGRPRRDARWREGTLSATGEGPEARPTRRTILLGSIVAGAGVVGCAGIVAGLAAHQSPSRGGQPTLRPGPLSWPPPALDRPIEIQVTEDRSQLELRPDSDYVVTMPKDAPLRAPGGLIIVGGRNVHLIAGAIEVPSMESSPDPKDRRGLYLKGQTGVVHVEGLSIDGADLTDGINLDQSADATVQFENVLVGTCHGSESGFHADVLQTWDGPNELRVDGLVGATTYQGLFLSPMTFGTREPRLFDLRRICIVAETGAHYLLWSDNDAGWLHPRDVVLIPLPTRKTLPELAYPPGQWPEVLVSKPGARVSIDLSSPGIGYVTPGYASGTS